MQTSGIITDWLPTQELSYFSGAPRSRNKGGDQPKNLEKDHLQLSQKAAGSARRTKVVRRTRWRGASFLVLNCRWLHRYGRWG